MWQLWQSLRLTKKLWCGVSVLLLGYLISLTLGIILGRHTEYRLQDVESSWFPAAMQSQQAFSEFNDLISTYAEAVIAGDLELLQSAEQETGEITQALKNIAGLPGLPREHLMHLQEIRQQVEDFTTRAQRVYAEMISSPSDEDDFSMLAESQEQALSLAQQTKELQQIFERLKAESIERLNAEISEIRTRSRQNRYLSIFVFIAVVGLALLVIKMLIRKSITRPVARLVDFANAIANGDVSQQLHMTNHDEIGELAEAFQRMNGTIQEITHKSQAIARGDLTHHVTPRSEKDVLGQALQQMSSYLSEIAVVAGAIAEGDLTKYPSVRSESDLFGHSMRQMAQSLQALIRQIRTSAEQIASLGPQINSLTEKETQLTQEVQVSMEQTISTLTEMSASVEQVSQNMETLLAFVQETSSAIAELTTTITTVASSTTDLNTETRQMSELVGKSMQAVEQINEQTEVSRNLSQETEQDAREGKQAVEQIRDSMDRIQEIHRHTVDTITQFADKSEEIGSILDVIQSINEQSSLLALNASISAAQAGSHGKGFSVIAEEMRSLSNDVAASTKTIAPLIQSIQQDAKTLTQVIHKGTGLIAQGSERTEQSERCLQKILFSVQQSSKGAHEIAAALHAQVNTNHDVMAALEHVSSMAAEIKNATNEQKTSMNEIQKAIEHIYGMAQQTQHATEEQLSGVYHVINAANTIGALSEHTVQSSQQINRMLSDDLAPQAQNLSQAVERFRLPA